ncbi:MAG: D-tyrosyl-tRNA(Tyr) deacylase [Archangium gephyra]|uniref:D-aminoacyl-tRNA deacylase n=1 Tax=Archangium gephyra TaxID=48 RepID=A0A2W5VTB9_9BACT|nr:MAG: D-tyrosyl-tRNA(Tyr) deacylase [Archangium gephyra]
MRAVLQRVKEASVTVDGVVTGKIGAGLLVLLGVGKGDTEADLDFMVDKIPQLRIFEDDAGKMNKSLLDTSKAMLAVSQFTLYADTKKGRRPSFIDAMPPDEAKRLYESFCARARALGVTVEEGIFAADMKVALINDGPVTICLDSVDRVQR